MPPPHPPFPFVPYAPDPVPLSDARRRGEALFAHLDARRSVRHFDATPVPRDLIETAIRTASTAPSGAHMQPWTFVAVGDPELKRQIREGAEEEERRSYEDRMPDEWLARLAPLGTTWQKPYLEVVPWIVVLFAQRWGLDGDRRIKHYYVSESCGIAAGLFITALHGMGLSTLTHTPSPMGFLNDICGRPAHEKPMILFPVGHAAADAQVPDLARKGLDEIAVFLE